MSDILKKHAAEVANDIRAHRYERTSGGIYLNRSRVFINGAMKVHDYRDNTNQFVSINANTLLNQGLDHALNVLMPPSGGYAQITQWYIAPFAGDYTPDAAATAATLPAASTEFTSYTSSTRLALTVSAVTSTQSTGNSGNEALMVCSTGGPYDVYGANVVSASAKSSTSGKALASVRFDNPRLDLTGGDKLGLEYVLTAADAG